MHHLSNLSVAGLVCIHLVLSLCVCVWVCEAAKGACSCLVWPLQWGDTEELSTFCLVDCFRVLRSDRCSPVTPLLSQCWCLVKQLLRSPIFKTLPASHAACISMGLKDMDGKVILLLINCRPVGLVQHGSRRWKGANNRKFELDVFPVVFMFFMILTGNLQ